MHEKVKGSSSLLLRRDGICRPGQTSVLPPLPIRSVLQSGYFSGFPSWGCKPALGGPLLFHILSYLSLSLSAFHPPISYHFPAPPLKVGPLNSAIVWGALLAPPAGSGAEPQPKLNLVHFSLKIRHLVATNLKIFVTIKWLDFMQNFQIYAEFGNTWIVQNIELRLPVKQ